MGKYSVLVMGITFFVSHFIFEKYLMVKIQGKMKKIPAMTITLSLEFILLTLAAYIEGFTLILTLGTIINASFISVYYRNKLSKINN